MQRVAITGMRGFLGWHTACRLRALHGVQAVDLSRDTLGDQGRLVEVLADVDAVIHIAGVNRAETATEVEQGNVHAAEQLAYGLRRAPRGISISYANSIQQDADTPYGRGKAQAAEILRATSEAIGSTCANVVLPNLFGEHARPDYNSFVATFARDVVQGRPPAIKEDRAVPLLHAQDAAAALVEGLEVGGEVRPPGETHGVAEIADQLKAMHGLYGERGEIPALTSAFHVNLFNTYRAAAWPGIFPIAPTAHSDQRGELFETLRSHGGTGQAFVSTTKPGQTRGEHYHLHKVERFSVIRGEAEISLRRLLSDDIVRFRMGGRSPSFVDMPTLWVHNIRNVGADELVTLFWADQLLDAKNPDQYQEKVRP